MKFKLQKTNRKKQDAIQKAIKNGLPLAGLLAGAAISTGCGEKNAPMVMGEIAPVEVTRSAVRGDVAPVESTSSNSGSETKRMIMGETPVPAPIGFLPPPVPPPLVLPRETETYVVKSGDRLSLIAKSYDVSLEVLKALNNFTGEQANHLQVGQKIIVPRKNNQDNEKAPLPTLGKPAPVDLK